MKHSERQHLKDNELAVFLGHVQDFVEEHNKTLTTVLGAALVIGVVVGGYVWWTSRVNGQAQALLAEAMVVAEAPVTPPTPPTGESLDQPVAPQPGYPTEQARLEAALPKFMAAADAYPSTDAGLTARYEAASAMVSLGRFDDAVTQYDRVAADADGVLVSMARLGKAEAQLRAGKFDEAIAGFKAVADDAQSMVPREAVLLELARAYEAAGQTDQARTTLNEIVEQHAESPTAAAAKEELDRLKG
ncbi:MAG: tol-pal system YbgF family protein [Vicinamibacterales bacterium]